MAKNNIEKASEGLNDDEIKENDKATDEIVEE